MLTCAVSVLKLVTVVLMSVRNTIATTANAVLHLVVVAPNLADKWLQLWLRNSLRMMSNAAHFNLGAALPLKLRKFIEILVH
jgi:hypothetical protein